MAYTYKPQLLNKTPADSQEEQDQLITKIRLEMGDTSFSPESAPGNGIKPDGTHFSDDELLYWYGQNSSNVLLTAYHTLTILSGMYAGREESISLPNGWKIDSKGRSKQLREAAAELKRRAHEQADKKLLDADVVQIVRVNPYGQSDC